MVDVLDAGSKIDAAPGMHRVERFEYILAAVGEISVAEQEAESSGGEIVLVIFLDGVAHECYASAVLGAMPQRAFRSHSFRNSLIVFRVNEGFGFAVVPSSASECGEGARDVLLEIQAESVLVRNVPRMVGDGGRSSGFGSFHDLIAIDAHVGGVGVGEDADHAALAGN